MLRPFSKLHRGIPAAPGSERADPAGVGETMGQWLQSASPLTICVTPPHYKTHFHYGKKKPQPTPLACHRGWVPKIWSWVFFCRSTMAHLWPCICQAVFRRPLWGLETSAEIIALLLSFYSRGNSVQIQMWEVGWCCRLAARRFLIGVCMLFL